MSGAIQIDRDIPVPNRVKFAFDRLDVGESFFVSTSRASAYTSKRRYEIDHPGLKFQVSPWRQDIDGRTVNGFRVWRVA